MNVFKVQVPQGISKLSQWTDFMNYLPTGKFILNKQVTGCGATTYFLEDTNPTPTVLCSHRTELLACKARADRHIGKVHLFKEASDKTAEDLQRNMASLREYLENPEFRGNPFTGEPPVRAPKILVTTDSLGHVLDVIESIGGLDQWMVVSDEMQCIFTDAAFKGNSVLGYIRNLDRVSRVIYLSATPYLTNYLDQIPEFKDLPYIELEWPSEMIDEVDLKSYEVRSLRRVALKKLKDWQATGYFEESGKGRATEAVMFLNSVTEILSLIKSTGLTQDQVNIICSKTSDKTLKKLKKLGMTVGSAPKEGDPHKPVTFVTKCAFEGVDFYNTNAYTYVFSNPNLQNLSVDLSIDLPQILGRQRLAINPWRTCATIYYQTTKDGKKETAADFSQYLEDREIFTWDYITKVNTSAPAIKKGYVNTLNIANTVKPFASGYVSVITRSDGLAEAMYNDLVKISEIRAWDIRNNLYGDKYCVMAGIEGAGLKVSNKDFSEFEEIFQNPGRNFRERMKAYCEFRSNHPEHLPGILGSVSIPKKYHEYYDNPGESVISACSYQESNIKKYLENRETSGNDKFKEDLIMRFSGITKITKAEAKSILSEIYQSHGITKKAKATDLSEFFEVSNTELQVNGKRLVGIKINGVKS